MDFLERLKEFTESLTYTPSTIEIGLYNEDHNSIALRPSPSNINERYLGKNKIYQYSFQVLIHDTNNYNAYQNTQKLLDEFESMNIQSLNNSFLLVSCKCTTVPNFVQKTNNGFLWTAIFNAELYM